MKKLLLGLLLVIGVVANGVEVKANNYTENGYYLYTNMEYVWASVDAEYRYDEAYKLLKLVNEYRVENGVPALKTNDTLMKIAMQRALESNILLKHESPYGGSYTLSSAYKVGATSAILDTKFMFNESQSGGYGTAQSALSGYKNSKAHWDHLMQQGDFANAKQYAIGVGFVNSTTIICMFSKETALLAASDTGLSNYSRTELVPVCKSYVNSDSLNPYEGYHFYSTKEKAEDASKNDSTEDTTEESTVEAQKNAVKATKTKLYSVTKKRSGRNNTRVTVKFSKKKGMKYQVQYAFNKKFTKGKKTFTVSSGKKTFTIKKKNNKSVYVRVRCMKKIEGKWIKGKWSTVKKFKTVKKR